MPFRRRKAYGRRRSRRMPTRFRRKRNFRRRAQLPRTSLLGNKRAVKFKYHDELILTQAGSGLATGFLFSANGMTDPNITGTGHKPRGFDQLMTMYDHYVIIGSKCVAKFLAVGVDDVLVSTKASNVGIVLRDTPTIQVQTDDILEDRNVSWKSISNFRAATPTSVSRKFSPKTYLGRASPLSDPQLKGDINNNPDEQAFYQIFIGPIGSINAGDMFVSVDITYIAVLIEPKLPPVSN